MKNASRFCAITLFLIVGFQASPFAQKTTTWKGGAPGRSTDWNCAANWKEGRIPDEFSRVIIPDVSCNTFSYPVIQTGEVEVLSLSCAPTAKLTIHKNARFLVIESTFDNNDIPVDVQAYRDTAGKCRLASLKY